MRTLRVEGLVVVGFLVLMGLVSNSGLLKVTTTTLDNGPPIVATKEDPSPFLSQITVIMLGMARICNPSIGLVRKIWQTHEEHMEGFSSVRRIVVLDGFGDARLEEKQTNATDVLDVEKYSEFKQRLRLFLNETTGDGHQEGPIDVIELAQHGGLVESMKVALEAARTPIVYVTQDDLAITHFVPTVGVVKTMMACQEGRNPVRFVLLNKRRNGFATRIDDFFGAWEAGNSTITNEKVLSTAPNQSITVDPASVHVPLLRTKRWSDNNHFAFKKDYLEFILPKANAAKKWVDSYIQGHLWKHPEDWIKFGTHMLGEQSENAYIYHFNGRNADLCNETLRDEQYASWLTQQHQW